MSSQPRFEYKYRLSISDYFKVRSMLASFAYPDDFSKRSAGGRYFIRSLYLDTFDYRCYAEKVTGERNRVKLRIRSYFRDRRSAEFVSFEIKTRHGSEVLKHGTHLPIEEYDAFEKTGCSVLGGNPVLAEFERLRRVRDLSPRVLVDYEREAFLPRDRSGVRITFDHDLRFAETARLFPESVFFRKGPRSLVVMEIKLADQPPKWVTRLVECYGLTAVPNSKYADGVEQSQKAFFSR